MYKVLRQVNTNYEIRNAKDEVKVQTSASLNARGQVQV
jgi:hypothetical protein